MYRAARDIHTPLPPLSDRFGIRDKAQVMRDLTTLARDGLRGRRFQFSVTSAGLLRPDLSLPAYAGRVPVDGLAPIFNLFDRVNNRRRYTQRVSRDQMRDFRGGRLSYDGHDGVDFVCPVGLPLVAAAPGRVVMIRDRWLRGGLTIAVDHGFGVLTHYTHCSRALTELGQFVERGEPVALSGSSGVDMTSFFPWVPPHIHFMVWVLGRPFDPYCTDSERGDTGTWNARNEPLPSGPLADDSVPDFTDVDEAALDRVILSCRDDVIRDELAAAYDEGPPYAAALAEDALHHDAYAWPLAFSGHTVRPADATHDVRVRLTMPLPATEYTGARFADTPWTAP